MSQSLNEKKKVLFDRIKKEKFCNLKGSEKLLSLIKHQKESNKKISEDDDNNTEIIEMLNKQQTLMKKLNHENMKLVHENEKLKSQVQSDQEIIDLLKLSNHE